MANVTGWNSLYNGNMFQAVFSLYDAALSGWTITILFLVFQLLIYVKTKNVTMMWITGLFFAGMYATSTFITTYLNQTQGVMIIFMLLILELAGILYYIFFK